MRAIGSASRAWRNACWRQASRRESASRSKGVQGAPAPILLDGFKRVRCECTLQISLVPFVPLGADELNGFVQMLNPLREHLELSRLGHGTELRLAEPGIAEVHGEVVRRHEIHGPCLSHRPRAA